MQQKPLSFCDKNARCIYFSNKNNRKRDVCRCIRIFTRRSNNIIIHCTWNWIELTYAHFFQLSFCILGIKCHQCTERTKSTLQYFFHNYTIFYRCSGEANTTVFTRHDFFTYHLSRITQWMILVQKQIVLTLRCSSGLLL